MKKGSRSLREPWRAYLKSAPEAASLPPKPFDPDAPSALCGGLWTRSRLSYVRQGAPPTLAILWILLVRYDVSRCARIPRSALAVLESA